MKAWHEWRDAPKLDLAVIGDPISHSLSPRMFAAAGIEEHYGAIRVPLDELDVALDHLVKLGLFGLNVTLPLKEAAFRWCASTDDVARQVGAVNTLRLADRAGRNTDVVGIKSVLADLQFDPSAEVLVQGAGGTARAVCVALHSIGARITLWNRSLERAHQMVNSLEFEVRVTTDLSAIEAPWIINTTSAGHSGAEIPMNFSTEHAGTAVDVSYATGGTKWLWKAQTAGWRTADGRGMLVAQGAASYEWWTGKAISRNAMADAVEEALAP